jgi:4-alpha-glucanotransferase
MDHFLTGVAVPVFSLRSDTSCGVGEFLDLIPLGSWCRRTGLELIQILPVNDTGSDPSPYNAQSAFALHPIYIRLENVPGWEICAVEIVAARQQFEAANRLQYERVLRFKTEILQRIFEHQRDVIRLDATFHEWIERNQWLEGYWKFLGKPALFTAWVQYHLDRQLRYAAQQLDAMGVALKGDVPILLSPDSADVRHNPTLFNMGLRVGAPPDMFSRDGQNWRFPSFRWQEMERDGFTWWRERLQRASHFYHAYRIDHVLGFFRIWMIPEDKESAALGYYEPAIRIRLEQLLSAGLNELEIKELVESYSLIRTESGYAPAWYWRDSTAYRNLDEPRRSKLHNLIEDYWAGQEALYRQHGRKLLESITKSTDMLVCGEDLGVVPQCVPETLEELGILGLRVERWAETDARPIPPTAYPRLTVSTTSTHDSSTLRGWWEEPGWNREAYFKQLNLDGNCPQYLTTEVCAAILKRNLNSNSMIVVLPLQDLFALHYDLRSLDTAGERINVPGVQDEINWTYRMKPSIESLIAYEAYNDYLAQLISLRRTKSLAASARVHSSGGVTV